jgi:hypothetical protein
VFVCICMYEHTHTHTHTHTGGYSGPDLDKFTELALTFYFYYVNFGPLSRGTAATGQSEP